VGMRFGYVTGAESRPAIVQSTNLPPAVGQESRSRATSARESDAPTISDHASEMRKAPELREPWPRRAPWEVPAPGARIESGKLHLWYGDESEPVLQLSPIEVGPVRDAVWTDFPEAR